MIEYSTVNVTKYHSRSIKYALHGLGLINARYATGNGEYENPVSMSVRTPHTFYNDKANKLDISSV